MVRRRVPIIVILAGMLALAAATTSFAITSIDSPGAQCRKIKKNDCAISWAYLSVGAAPSFMQWIRVIVEGQVVFHATAFFQQSMYVSYQQIGDSIPVKCGKAGSSPDPHPSPNPALPYGNKYNYVIEARDSAGLIARNFGSVQCPPK